MKRLLAWLLGAGLLLGLAACGAPEPREQQTCTISISCAVLLEQLDRLPAAKQVLVPEDGWLLPPTEVSFTPGETVFDVLQRETRARSIHMEFSSTPLYNTAYIEGIGNLYEFDCGESSGWMFSVNKTFPTLGCSACPVEQGDQIAWQYTLSLGEDLGESTGGPS